MMKFAKRAVARCLRASRLGRAALQWWSYRVKGGGRGTPMSAYASLDKWAQFNAGFLDRMGLVRAAERFSREQSQRTSYDAKLGRAPTGASAFEAREYQRELRRLIREERELDSSVRDEPWNILVHDTVSQNAGEAGYEIEVITWDAYPGLSVPANIYRPLNQQGARFPVVITPLSAGCNVATHDRSNSVQRRAANLALRGCLVLAMGGLLKNGWIGEIPENLYAHEQIGRLAGTGLSTSSIELMMFERAIDYLCSRSDVDVDRIAVAGHCHGGTLALLLAWADPRISAIATVSTAFSLSSDVDGRLYTDARHLSRKIRSPEAFVTSTDVPRLFPARGRSESTHSSVPIMWRKLGKLSLLAPNPVLFVLGRGDSSTSPRVTAEYVGALGDICETLDPKARPPRLELVEGGHNFDASRRRLVTDWLLEALGVCSERDGPREQPEVNTPLLPRETLEPRPRERSALTIREIHERRALEAIEIHAAAFSVGAKGTADAKGALRELLMLPQSNEVCERRPILVDEGGGSISGIECTQQFWLLPLTRGLTAAMSVVASSLPDVQGLALHLPEHGRLLPSEEELRELLREKKAVIVPYVPGLEPLAPTQVTVAQWAIVCPTKIGRTLLGLGVETVSAAIDLSEVLWPDELVAGVAHGVDACNILAFSVALDARIQVARLIDGVRSFREFVEAEPDPLPSPTMAIPGLAVYADLPDVVRLAETCKVSFEGRSLLKEFEVRW